MTLKKKIKEIAKEHQLGNSPTRYQTQPLLSRGTYVEFMCWCSTPICLEILLCLCPEPPVVCFVSLGLFSANEIYLLSPDFFLARCLVTAESVWARMSSSSLLLGWWSRCNCCDPFSSVMGHSAAGSLRLSLSPPHSRASWRLKDLYHFTEHGVASCFGHC